MPEKIYAAYGVLMCEDTMLKICPSARIADTGELEDYRLMFVGDKPHSRATVEAERGFYVPAVFWTLPEGGEHLISEALERWGDYHSVEIQAVVDGKKVMAITHVKNEDEQLNPPDNKYYTDIHNAYEEYGFDSDILEEALEYSDRRMRAVTSELADTADFRRNRAAFFMEKNMDERIWEQQPDESSKAYEAFVFYRDLGAGRTMIEVARSLKKSYSLIRRWSENWNWDERASAWDNHLTEKAADKAAQEYAQMIERQISIGKMLQARAAKAIQSLDFAKVSARALPALMKMMESGVRIEQSAREIAATQNPQKSLTIKIVAQETPIGGEAFA